MVQRESLGLGGAAGDPAVTVSGHTWTYGEFTNLIDTAPVGGLVDISSMTLPLALATALAAARAGTAVLVRDPALPPPRIAALPPETWLVATTSGSSGRPRAICRTARSWALSVRPLADITAIGAADRVALTGPLHATLHLFAAIHTLYVGGHLTDDIREATAVHCVPAVLADLTESATGVGNLRTAVVAGSALPKPVARRAAAQGISVVEYYGAAELSFVAIRRWPEPMLRPFPGVELRLGAHGRLWVRSPYRALGYATPVADAEPTAGAGGAVASPPDSEACSHSSPDANPAGAGASAAGPVVASSGDPGRDATMGRAAGPAGARAATLGPRRHPLRVDADGFATVGDLARAADTGPMDGLVILGRGDAAITVGGATVLAEDIEAALCAIPGVAAAAAVGLPHPRLGETVAAVLELDGTASLAAIRTAARAALAGAARPRKYVIVDRIPRTATGKIARAATRRLLTP